jgi:hypothetical protein
MRIFYASVRIFPISLLILCLLWPDAFGKQQYEAKSAFFKNKPPVWQRTSENDTNIMNEFFRFFNTDLKSKYDNIITAPKAIEFLKISEGYKYINGRIFKADSSLMLYAYKILIVEYNNKGDCENARAYAEKYKALKKTDYLVMNLFLEFQVYDPYIDSEIYEVMKNDDFVKVFGYIDNENCFTEKEFDDLDYPNGDKDTGMKADGDKKTEANRILKAGFRISAEDEHFYWRFQELSAPAYNAIRSGDPDTGIKIAEQEIEFLKKSDGRDFAVGRKFKYESSLLLDAYVNLISAYDKKNDCENARAYYEKYKSVAAGDYLVVDYFYFRVFDPVADKDVYAGKKSRDLRIISDSITYGNCFSDEEYDSLLNMR